MRRTRLLASLTLSAVLLSTLGATAPAQASGHTIASAINTTDGSSLFDFAFQIRRVMHGAVDQTNLAVAYASCENCQTVAVSFQVVLVTGDADEVTPENVAIAVNEECSSCATLASAYQFVLSTDGPVRFTPDGNRRLAEMRQRLTELSRSDLGVEELQAEFDLIAADLRDVLANQLVQAGPRGRLDADRQSESPRPGHSEATTSPTPDVTDTASPSPSPSPSTTATTAPTETASPTTTEASPPETTAATATESDALGATATPSAEPTGSTPEPTTTDS